MIRISCVAGIGFVVGFGLAVFCLQGEVRTAHQLQIESRSYWMLLDHEAKQFSEDRRTTANQYNDLRGRLTQLEDIFDARFEELRQLVRDLIDGLPNDGAFRVDTLRALRRLEQHTGLEPSQKNGYK